MTDSPDFKRLVEQLGSRPSCTHKDKDLSDLPICPVKGDGYRLVEAIPCQDCGAPTWATPYISGWYISPWCHRCLDADERSSFARRTAANEQASTQSAYRNAGLLPGDLQTRRATPLPYRELHRGPSMPWCGYVVGTHGTGKTTAAVSTVADYVERGWRCRYFVEGDLLEQLRPSFVGKRVTQRQLASLDLLVIDEFGSDGRTPWEVEQLRRIINERYRRQAPLLLASNHSLATITQREGMGRQVLDRLVEGMGGMRLMCAASGAYQELTWSYRMERAVDLPSGCLNVARMQA